MKMIATPPQAREATQTGLGNRLRHDDDSIEEDKLFDIVRNDLPTLCAAL